MRGDLFKCYQNGFLKEGTGSTSYSYERNHCMQLIIKEPPNIYSDHIGDKDFDHYSEVGPFLEVPNQLHTYNYIYKCLIIMPRGEFICRTKLPLQDILFTLVSTLQVTVFSCSYNSCSRRLYCTHYSKVCIVHFILKLYVADQQ